MKRISKDKGAGASQTEPVVAEADTKSHRVRDSYVKFLRKFSSKKASIVRIPAGQIQERIEWSKGKGSGITEIPKIENPNIEIVDLYPVFEPYSYIRVTFNNENSEYVLETLEPRLTEEEGSLLRLVKELNS